MQILKSKYKLFFISFLLLFLPIDPPRLLANQSALEKISLEGYYVKDKLLNYFSEQVISNYIIDKDLNNEEFIGIGISKNLSKFDYLEIIFENNKKDYFPIALLQGFINFSDNQKCLERKEKILNEISPSFNKNTLRRDDILSDRTGKNKLFQTHIFLDYGDTIKLQCIDLDDQYKKENKEFEGFKFIVSSYKYSEYLKLIN